MNTSGDQYYQEHAAVNKKVCPLREIVIQEKISVPDSLKQYRLCFTIQQSTDFMSKIFILLRF